MITWDTLPPALLPIAGLKKIYEEATGAVADTIGPHALAHIEAVLVFIEATPGVQDSAEKAIEAGKQFGRFLEEHSSTTPAAEIEASRAVALAALDNFVATLANARPSSRAEALKHAW
jgi:hypothetical protein